MKVTLVVASGVHQGKAIPILGPQFLIGRDPQCHLRPASQAVSKQHCAVVIRDGKVYVKDFGSTNGTLVNDAAVQNEERLVVNNDSLKIGPLDFTIRIEPSAVKADGTPLPDMNPEAAAALAAVKAVSAPAPASKNATPAPRPGVPAKQPDNLETPKPAGSDTLPTASREGDENDRLAAMLLGLDDGPVEVPEGSTVAEMPAVDLGQPGSGEGATGEKKDSKKQVPTREDTSSAASEILRKYMRRPK